MLHNENMSKDKLLQIKLNYEEKNEFLLPDAIFPLGVFPA